MPTTYAIPNGATQFAASTYTGNGSTQAIVNSGNNPLGVTFQPDLVWIKDRIAVSSQDWFDSVRGVTKLLYSNSTAIESVFSGVTSFNTNGFTVGSGSSDNANGNATVAWQWKAGGAAVTNTAGSISSQVSANTTAGFSIVTYTGTGANATIGHGLSNAPKMIIVKGRSTVTNWAVYHTTIGQGYLVYLSGTNSFIASSTAWNNTSPTTSVFSVGAFGDTNNSSTTYVAYCFSEIAGYSKFGGYTGTGSVDGNFIYTGFRPRTIILKDYGSPTTNWILQDTSRDTFNQSSTSLSPNSNAAQSTYGSSQGIDILSNGFKIRVAGAPLNVLNNGVLYAAFAENPFKYANAR